ncbi:MAG: hypothetical protein KGK01_02030 [Bradyrhizobium sp.]|uniref:hypothetical protein n=1 Tax=Bradyrhizobium sp. TaxID=376 RepID=UPI001C28EA71|nr:hypothetical protein [Bradyrhizobium sp.]MBU6463586.1 hypothetical protein [Pseudomonadota bacterium]MDE2067028.1 hypothetical protein [Bradyrhizobium sp.]MDE2241242.1 hypothetical protein [Bradyrhizobium sp.]MDE2470761.1 hypothetical protein [Bradyrhizobium sp.]
MNAETVANMSDCPRVRPTLTCKEHSENILSSQHEQSKFRIARAEPFGPGIDRRSADELDYHLKLLWREAVVRSSNGKVDLQNLKGLRKLFLNEAALRCSSTEERTVGGFKKADPAEKQQGDLETKLKSKRASRDGLVGRGKLAEASASTHREKATKPALF